MKHINHIVGVALVCYGCSSCGRAPSFMLVPGDIWIRDVTVVSPERDVSMPHAHVVVRGGRIASVGLESPGSASGITVVEGAGKFLTPGLIDGHVHLAEVPGMSPADVASKPALVAAYFKQLPRSYLYFGFTTVVDLNIVDRARVDDIRKAELGPAVFDCGNALEIANGYLMSSMPPAERFERNPNFVYDARQAAGSIPSQYSPEDHSPEAAAARVERTGGRCVKASYEPGYGDLAGKLPVPTLEMMEDVREASHRHHLPLLLHANSYEAHKFAVDARVDGVVHGIFSGEGVEDSTRELPQKVLAVLDDERELGMAYMPTSRVLSGLSDLFAPEFLGDAGLNHAVPADLIAWYRTDEGRWFAKQLAASGFFKARTSQQIHDMFGSVAQRGRATRYIATTGGRIVFGSDTPSAPTYANPPGYNGYLELRELEAIGLSPRQILMAATGAAAHLFKLDADYGTVAPGKAASLLLLRDDPMKSTAAWDSIETVIVRGRVVPRAILSAHAN